MNVVGRRAVNKLNEPKLKIRDGFAESVEEEALLRALAAYCLEEDGNEGRKRKRWKGWHNSAGGGAEKAAEAAKANVSKAKQTKTAYSTSMTCVKFVT